MVESDTYGVCDHYPGSTCSCDVFADFMHSVLDILLIAVKGKIIMAHGMMRQLCRQHVLASAGHMPCGAPMIGSSCVCVLGPSWRYTNGRGTVPR